MDEIKRFKQLLETAKSEHELQTFLEDHPHLLLDLPISPKATVITQFPLGADFISDFAFVHSNSGGNFLDLVELENPKVQIFNHNGSFSQHFNHALQQIQDWVAWCRLHQDPILRQIRSLVRYLKSDNLYVNALLVMGRRNELSNRQRQERFEARLHQLPRGIQIQTYDGFAERIDDSNKWIRIGYKSARCLRYGGQGFKEKTKILKKL